MKETYIYVLKDPITNKIRYVGKSNKPEYRFKNHINNCRDKNTRKRNWINELRKEKIKPILEIIDIVPVEEWKKYEKIYIKKYIESGCDLVNYTEGGDGATFANATSFKQGHGAKKVVMLDKNGTYMRTFDKIIDANAFTKKNNGVSQVLSKRNKTSGGYLFIYEEEYKNMTKEDIDEFVQQSKPKKLGANKTSFKKGSIPLKRIKTTFQYDINGNFIKEWKSASEAQRYYNLRGGIINCVNNKNKSAGGYLWSYIRKNNIKD